jgi:hypothetical protein
MLLWQQAVCQGLWHRDMTSPTIFEKIKSPKSSFYVFPNFKIRFPADQSDKPNFGVSQGQASMTAETLR